MTYRELISELCQIRQLCNAKDFKEVTERVYVLLDRLTDVNGFKG